MALIPSIFTHALNPGKIYDPVGHCIYCGRLPSANDSLSDEHIIPLCFAGRYVLPVSSCADCRDITGKIEDHCFKGFIFTARHHLGLKGRHKMKRRTTLPINFHSPDATASVPVEDHPSAITMPVMPWPDGMSGLPPIKDDVPPGIRVAFKPVVPNFIEKVKALGGNVNLTKGGGVSALECYRLIAKIAHAFTTAELGWRAFSPTLRNLIKREPPMFANHFVGSGFVELPPSNQLHEINFSHSIQTQWGELIVVKMRLFANLEMPTYYAISGIKIPLHEQPKPSSSEEPPR
jgi:hypothetical protein